MPLWQRVAAAVMLLVASFEIALLEAFTVPLRLGTVPFPISVALVLVANVLLPRFAYAVTGSRLVAGATLAVWLLVVLALATGRPEGDVVVPGTVTGLALVFGGAAAAAFGLGRALAQWRADLVLPRGRAARRLTAAPGGAGTGDAG